jgi:hypothetical protein
MYLPYHSKPGYFLVEETNKIVAYQTLLTVNTEDSAIPIETIKLIANGNLKPRLYCLCHSIEPIPMHFQRVRMGDKMVHFWDNAGNKLTHTSECPRAKSEDVQRSKQKRQTLPGVEWTTGANGQIGVDVHIDPFAKDEETKIKKVSAQINTSEAESIDRESPQSQTSSSRSGGGRRRSKFEGLIRAWYEIGRAFAAKEAQTVDGKQIALQDLNLKNLIWGMWRVMLNDQPNNPFRFTISGKRAATFAYVPTKKAENFRRVGEQKILLGKVTRVQMQGQEIQLNLEGINSEWKIIAPRQEIPFDLINYLAVFRGIYEQEGHFRATHKPLFVLIAVPGAVWTDSEYERDTYHELRNRNFKIEKPMQESEEFFGYRPDFVVRDFRLPVVIEVYGMRGNQKYDEHKEVKREIYRKAMERGLIWYLEWDATRKTSWIEFLIELDRLANATG